MSADSSKLESLPAPAPEGLLTKSQPTKIDRRDFLKLAGAGFAATILPRETSIKHEGDVTHIFPPEGGQYSVIYVRSHELPMNPSKLPRGLDGLFMELSKNRDYIAEGINYLLFLKNENRQYGSLFGEFERRVLPLLVGEPRFKPERLWVGADFFIKNLESVAGTAIGTLLLKEILEKKFFDKPIGGDSDAPMPTRRQFLKISAAALATWFWLPELSMTVGGGSKEWGGGWPQEFTKAIRKLHPEWGVFLLKSREVISALNGEYLLQRGDKRHVGYIWGGAHAGVETELLHSRRDKLEFLRAMTPILCKVFEPESLYTIVEYKFNGQDWKLSRRIEVPESKEIVQPPIYPKERRGKAEQIILASPRIYRTDSPEYVLDKISEVLDKASPDVVITPEFTFHKTEGQGNDIHTLPVVLGREEGEYLVQEPTGEKIRGIIERAKDLARKYKTNLFLGTFYESLNGLVSEEDYQRGAIEYRNTMLHINPEGKIVGIKRKFYEPDDEFTVTAKGGITYKVLPLICEELWDNREGSKIIVPDWVKKRAPYDILVHELSQGDVNLDSLSLYLQGQVKMGDEERRQTLDGLHFYYNSYLPFLNRSEAHILISDIGQSGYFPVYNGNLAGG